MITRSYPHKIAMSQRRLFYVGLTRAQDNLIFTTSDKIISQNAKKSRFLELIPDRMILDSDMKTCTEKRYEVHRDIPNLNYSAINTFVDCPLRYTLIYDYGFKTPASFTQNLGIFVHNTLQRINESIKKGKEILPAQMKEMVDTYWIDLPMSKEKNRHLKDKQIKQFINYYLTANDDFKEILAIEESFSYIGNNMIIKGKVDLIVRDKDDNVCLIDFKARGQKGIEDTNVGKQLQMYDYCLDTRYNIDKLIAYTFTDNKRTDFPVDKEYISEFLTDMSIKMAKEDFQKQKNAMCSECPFKFYCWSDK